jgi:hypothetical protein
MSRSLFDTAACAWRIGYGEETRERRRATSGEGLEGGECGGGGQVKRFARKGDHFPLISTAAAVGENEGDEGTTDQAARAARAAEEQRSRRRSGGEVDGAGDGRRAGGDDEKRRWKDVSLQVK